MINTTELNYNDSNDLQPYNLDQSRQLSPTSFNLHQKISNWITDYKENGFTLKSLTTDDSSPIETNSSNSRRKSAKLRSKNSGIYEIRLTTGKRCIHKSRSRVDLSIHGHTYTLLLLPGSDNLLDWFILDLKSVDEWPGNLRLFTRQVFDELLQRTY